MWRGSAEARSWPWPPKGSSWKREKGLLRAGCPILAHPFLWPLEAAPAAPENLEEPAKSFGRAFEGSQARPPRRCRDGPVSRRC